MLISRTSSSARGANFPNLRSEALPFNLRTVNAVLRGRLERGEAARRARMLLEDVPRLTGGRFRLRFIERADSEIWPYYIFTNHESRPDYFNPAFHFQRQRRRLWIELGRLGDALQSGQVRPPDVGRVLGAPVSGAHETFRQSHFHRGRTVVARPVEIAHSCATGVRVCAPCWRMVDWQFETQGVVINLEVKYRNHDWLRFVDLVSYINQLDSYFDTLGGQISGQSRGTGQPGWHHVVGFAWRAAA